jgi:hypothetical protein
VADDEFLSRQNENIAGLVVGLVVVTILVVVTFGLLVVVSLRVVVDGADLDVVDFSVVAFVVLIVDDWAFCFDKMN